MVVNNIALKDSDYPGAKNISRMRNAIVNHAKFLGNGGAQVNGHQLDSTKKDSEEFNQPTKQNHTYEEHHNDSAPTGHQLPQNDDDSLI